MSFNYIYKYKDRLIPYGFTGHEMLDDFELINMNGRMYDPVVCRFLSPDPYIQMPDNTQSYNRYSYCMNNPLTMTDPSGYNWLPWTMAADFLSGGTISRTAAYVGGFASIMGISTLSTVGATATALPSSIITTTYATSGAILAHAGPLARSIDYMVGGAVFFRDIFSKKSFEQSFERLYNAMRIDFGLLISLPWEAEQASLGNMIAHTKNFTGHVDDVWLNHWSIVVNEDGNDGYGFTLGNIINAKGLSKPNNTIHHEYGHAIQSKLMGNLYLTKVAIPSFNSYYQGNYFHDHQWYEVFANYLGGVPYNEYFYPRKPMYNTFGHWIYYFLNPLPLTYKFF